MEVRLTKDLCCSELYVFGIGTNLPSLFNYGHDPIVDSNNIFRDRLLLHFFYEMMVYTACGGTVHRSDDGEYYRKSLLGTRPAGARPNYNKTYMPWDMATMNAYIGMDEFYADKKAEALVDCGFKFVRGVFSNKYPERPLLIFNAFPPEVFKKAVRLAKKFRGDIREFLLPYYDAVFDLEWVRNGCPFHGKISLKQAIENYQQGLYKSEDDE